MKFSLDAGSEASVRSGALSQIDPKSAHNAADVEILLTSLWKEFLDLDHVSLDDNFFDLGGDSLVGSRLFKAVNDVYTLDLRLSLLFDCPTIRQLAQYIRQENQVMDLYPNFLKYQELLF